MNLWTSQDKCKLGDTDAVPCISFFFFFFLFGISVVEEVSDRERLKCTIDSMLRSYVGIPWKVISSSFRSQFLRFLHYHGAVGGVALLPSSSISCSEDMLPSAGGIKGTVASISVSKGLPRILRFA